MQGDKLLFKDCTDGLKRALAIGPREMVAFAGAGGKTSALRLLAAELAKEEHSVLITTTTHVFLKQVSDLGRVMISSDLGFTEGSIDSELHTNHAVVAGRFVNREGKLVGLPPELLDNLWQLPITDRKGKTNGDYLVDYMLIEADGARGASLKAPAEHEPVIPTETTLVVQLLGIDVLGKPLGSKYTHRPERIAALLRARPGLAEIELSALAVTAKEGAEEGALVTEEIVAKVVAESCSLMKQVLPNARIVPMINKVDVSAGGIMPKWRVAARLATSILRRAETIDKIIVGSCRSGCFTVLFKEG